VAIGGGVQAGSNWLMSGSYPSTASPNPTGWTGSVQSIAAAPSVGEIAIGQYDAAESTVYAMCFTPPPPPES
jgi:hypothetical protein